MDLHNTALKIAMNIITAGRISDFDDWEEMKIELEYELLNLISLTDTDRKEMVQTVKDHWYE